MSRGRLDAIAGWSLFLVFIALAVITWLWFLVLAIDSFKWQEGSGLPRADLGLLAQIALGVGVLVAGLVFVWAGLTVLSTTRVRVPLAPGLALLAVAAGATVLAAAAPTIVHPVRLQMEGGVDRSLAGAVPWVSYFRAVAAMTLACAVFVVAWAAMRAWRGTGARRFVSR